MEKRNKRGKTIFKGCKVGMNNIRTTFRLTEEALIAMEWLVEKTQFSRKDILDSAISTLLSNKDQIYAPLIETCAADTISNLSIRKTQVISKSSLNILNNISKAKNIPRDLLVKNLILLLERSLKDVEKPSQRKIEAVDLISEFVKKGYIISEKLQSLLGNNSNTIIDFNHALMMIEKLLNEIGEKLQDGTVIKNENPIYWK